MIRMVWIKRVTIRNIQYEVIRYQYNTEEGPHVGYWVAPYLVIPKNIMFEAVKSACSQSFSEAVVGDASHKEEIESCHCCDKISAEDAVERLIGEIGKETV